MPSYEYKHDSCNHEWEEWKSIKNCMPTPEDKCPKCGGAGNITLLVSGGSGKGVVELTGQDLINKTKEDAQKLKRDIHGSEKLYANVLGEAKYHELQTRLDRKKR